MRDEGVMPKTVWSIVSLLCADYDRRAEALILRSVSHPTEMEYKYLNYRILEAAREIAGERDAPDFIREIGGCIGYAKSSLPYLSESVYKQRKSQIRQNIARRLHLID